MIVMYEAEEVDMVNVFPTGKERCTHPFILGHNGTVGGCDECTGVKRDLAGHAWDRHQTVAHYQEDDGTITKVSRRVAFAHRNPALRPLYDLNRILDILGSPYVVDEETDTHIILLLADTIAEREVEENIADLNQLHQPY